jgi:NAD dependent epimerase/dehydratase family enzyme
MADEALLASTRVAPQRLLELEYSYRYPALESALEHVMGTRKV